MKVTKAINAKNAACPDPLELVKAEISRGGTEFEILLDNPVSASSVMRFLEKNNFGVQLKDDEGTITISARKKEQPLTSPALKKQPDIQPKTQENQEQAEETQTAPKPRDAEKIFKTPAAFSVLITSNALGAGGSSELGETLMKNFLNELQQMEQPPAAVALMNGGVKLALYDSSACDHLKNLEKRGTSILVNGTCANYFNILDQIGAGSISNMPEIIDTLNRADKIMTI